MSNSVGRCVTADFCTCCVGGAYTGVTASMVEMDFQRSLAGAAQKGDIGSMRGWLARGAKVDGDGESGYAPLHYAARQGHVEACLLLLQSGAQVNRRTRAGQATSLHRAAYAGHIEVVKVLLEHGASVEAQDSDGQTCLHKASMQGHTAVVELLKESCPRAYTILDNQNFAWGALLTGMELILLTGCRDAVHCLRGCPPVPIDVSKTTLCRRHLSPNSSLVPPCPWEMVRSSPATDLYAGEVLLEEWNQALKLTKEDGVQLPNL